MSFPFSGFPSGRSDSLPHNRASVVGNINAQHHAHGHHIHGLHHHSHASSVRQSMEESRDLANRAAEIAALPTRRLVIPDPVALKYLADDTLVQVAEERTTLEGYELYLVEQWACSRQSPSTVIATYTGDTESVIVVGVIAVPEDESMWSPKLRTYLQAIQQFHTRPRETPLGDLITTNLSTFPSALTAIPVPGGDIRQYLKIFYVNENFKRMGCSGRAGLTLHEPLPATQAKFYSTYRIHERIDSSEAVIELVRLCQYALIIFGQLNQIYTDGLLCDVTETAIRNWWTDVGQDYYNAEASDGSLGPTTVSVLLGTLMGARNRLNSHGSNVPKDPFDIDGMARGISHFQKYQKLNRTGTLDPSTLVSLRRVTAKAAANEGWAVPRAVKHTVAEIGGKRGELVIDLVGGRDKGGISDMETLDPDKFIASLYGETPKWLWYGKARRSVTGHHEKHAAGGIAQRGAKEQQIMASTSMKVGPSTSRDTIEGASKEDLHASIMQATASAPFSPTKISTETTGDRQEKKSRFKSGSRKTDSRSGLGRIKDAVGGARKSGRGSRDDYIDSGSTSGAPTPSGYNGPTRSFTWKSTPEAYLQNYKKDRALDLRIMPPTLSPTGYTPVVTKPTTSATDTVDSLTDDLAYMKSPSLVGSLAEVTGTSHQTMDHEIAATTRTRKFYRRHSISDLHAPSPQDKAHWPRRSSFSVTEEAILRWEEVAPMFDIVPSSAQMGCLLELARDFCRDVTNVKTDIEPWVDDTMKLLNGVQDRFVFEEQEIRNAMEQAVNNQENMAMTSKDIVNRERDDLTAEIKELDTLLARLDYTIGNLEGKVQEVEDGVEMFEKQVLKLEDRSHELRSQLETESWMHWLARSLTGIGTGPNILRAAQKY